MSVAAAAVALLSVVVGAADHQGARAAPTGAPADEQTRSPDTTYPDTATPTSPSTATPPGRSRVGPPRWVAVLRHLDAIRSQAWRQGDADSLNQVFVPESDVLAQDRRRLRAYTGRDLTVSNVHLDFLRVAVLERRRGCVRLDVVDRLDGAIAVDRDGWRRPLPHDRATHHLVELQRTQHRWRISAVSVLER